jgi:hypothetical protein
MLLRPILMLRSASRASSRTYFSGFFKGQRYSGWVKEWFPDYTSTLIALFHRLPGNGVLESGKTPATSR